MIHFSYDLFFINKFGNMHIYHHYINISFLSKVTTSTVEYNHVKCFDTIFNMTGISEQKLDLNYSSNIVYFIFR